MLRTITVGTCTSVQGLVVNTLPDGRIVIQVGEQTYTGRPIAAPAKAAA